MDYDDDDVLDVLERKKHWRYNDDTIEELLVRLSKLEGEVHYLGSQDLAKNQRHVRWTYVIPNRILAILAWVAVATLVGWLMDTYNLGFWGDLPLGVAGAFLMWGIADNLWFAPVTLAELRGPIRPRARKN